VHREVVGLIVLGLVVVVGFFVTRAAASANRTLRSRDAATWYAVARHEQEQGRAADAVPAFRRAVTLDRGRRNYRLALGGALAATGDDAAARQTLLEIRDASPDSADVNVQLAHLEAHGGHVDAAVRDYESALQGMWRDDERDVRRRLRVELIRFLLARNLRSRALSELLTLTSTLPDDSGSENEAAQLLLEAGDPARALALFRRVLEREPSNGVALEGAGVAAFHAGDYLAAQRYLRAAPAPLSSQAATAQTISGLVLSRDPLRPGLGLEERRRRLVSDVASARARVATVLMQVTDDRDRERLERLRESTTGLDATLRAENLRQFPDAIDAAVREVYRIEQEAASYGAPAAIDQALMIIGRRHEADQ
jgi:cellulose synthase operon protein C